MLDMKTFSKIWVWLAIGVPGLFAFVIAADPKAIAEANTLTGVVFMFAVRQLAFAAVSLYAWLKLPPQATAALLVGRGATDLADGAITLGIAGSAMGAAPIAMGLVSLVVARAVARGL